MTFVKVKATKMTKIGYSAFLLLGAVLVPLASAQAQTTNPSAVLSGKYAFYLSGQEKLPTGGTDLEGIAGTFSADGQGNITAGQLDKNSGTGLVQTSTLKGTYTNDGAAGKVTVTLQLPMGPLSFAFYTRGVSPVSNVAIIAGGASFQSASGRLATTQDFLLGNALLGGGAVTFTLDGETAAIAGALKGILSLNFASDLAPSGNYLTQQPVAGLAEVVQNGTASFYTNINGIVPNVPGAFGATRSTVTLTGLSSGSSNFAAYVGNFGTGNVVLLSLDPHGAAPLLIGTNGSLSPSFVEAVGTLSE